MCGHRIGLRHNKTGYDDMESKTSRTMDRMWTAKCIRGVRKKGEDELIHLTALLQFQFQNETESTTDEEGTHSSPIEPALFFEPSAKRPRLDSPATLNLSVFKTGGLSSA